MVKELAYVLITPYSLIKSRTGGIIGRLLSSARLEFVGARMFMPGDVFVDRYEATIELQHIAPSVRKALINYLNECFRPKNRIGIVNRSLVLLFYGENAISHISKIAGPMPDPKGDTIRGTYGDFIGYRAGELRYFDPAVLTSADPQTNRLQLELFAEYAEKEGGIFEKIMPFPRGQKPETTLVIIKPDNFYQMSSRPGNIIDSFSRSGLYIVGAKLLHLTVRQAEEFYGPLRRLFVEKLKGGLRDKVRSRLADLGFTIEDEIYDAITDLLKDINAKTEFNRIVQYMTGTSSDDAGRHLHQKPGKSLALLYQGINAVEKIRALLGSTDPRKADEGTVRSDYGRDLMRNGAHASDSVASAERERKIVDLWNPELHLDFQRLIKSYLRKGKI
ncbi:MAG: nucleoside-diphosphate kinase [Planctomycetota bacterium]